MFQYLTLLPMGISDVDTLVDRWHNAVTSSAPSAPRAQRRRDRWSAPRLEAEGFYFGDPNVPRSVAVRHFSVRCRVHFTTMHGPTYHETGFSLHPIA